MTRKVLPRSRYARGVKILHDPVLNKDTAFNERERVLLGLRGLLPPRVQTQEEQVSRVMENVRSKTTELERYVHLVGLMDRNENLFYRVIMDNLEELMPVIYTPTVGLACQRFGHIYRRSRGLYVSLQDRGGIKDILCNWPHRDARIMVVTDGERILGLGDLGADGMGIPIGKLALYTACAGISPTLCLPVTLDTGTNNRSLLEDPLYLGLAHERVRGEEYDEFIQEFIEAALEVFPDILIQLEDFANVNAFRMLSQYRDKICVFNDDIQGTGSVALAGLYSALRMTKTEISDHRILFLGAGEAGIGIGDMICAGMVDEGIPPEKAREHCWFWDVNGLIESSRNDLMDFDRPYAHDHPPLPTFLDAVKELRPTMLVGVSTAAGAFSREVIEAMSEFNERPIIFALSNPTSKAECTAEEAYGWSGGKAIFASGSPFDPVEYEGKTYYPGQGNNAYVFPGVGLGIIASKARKVTDGMFLEAAKALAGEVTNRDRSEGRIYPPLTRIRSVSASIADSVARAAYKNGLAGDEEPDDLGLAIRQQMYSPVYPTYV